MIFKSRVEANQSKIIFSTMQFCVDELFARNGCSPSEMHEPAGSTLDTLSPLLDSRNMGIRQILIGGDKSILSAGTYIIELVGSEFALLECSSSKEIEEIIKSEQNAISNGVIYEVWNNVIYDKVGLLEGIYNLYGGRSAVLSSLFHLVLCTTAIESLAIIFALINMIIIDNAIMAKNMGLLFGMVSTLVMFVLVRASVGVVKHLYIRNIYAKHSFTNADSLFKLVLGYPIQWFYGRSSNDIHNRVDSSILVVKKCVLQIADGFTSGVVSILSLIAIYIFAPWISIICLLVFALNFSIRYFYRHYLTDQHHESLVTMVELERFSIQSFVGISSIKMGCAERDVGDIYSNIVRRLAGIQFKIAGIIANTRVASEILSGVVYIAIIFYLALNIANGETSVGVFFLIVVLYRNYDNNSIRLLNLMFDIQEVKVHFERAMKLTASPDAVPDVDMKKQDERLEELEKISFSRVSVEFGGTVTGALDNVNFDICNNEKVLITGESGSGKSLLVQLLSGELQPTKGTVRIHHKNSSSSVAEYQRHIAVVHQNDFLFTGSLLNNITMGEIEPDLTRVKVCTEIVAIDKLIEDMPMKYNTEVGISSDGISGGQAQRVLIARALYDMPKVLVLDESTSNLDIESELILLRTMRALPCAIVYVSGRRDLERYFDRVLDLS